MFILGDRAMSQRMFMIERVSYINMPNQVDYFKVVCYLTLPFRKSLHSHLHQLGSTGNVYVSLRLFVLASV